MNKKTYTHTIGDKTIVVELNDWAAQANGAVLVRLGDTVVLATAVMNKTPRPEGDFFPLTVDYEEKYYATGKILGSRFVKRETRPSEEAILAARVIDRSIRPRFNLRMRNDVQVILTVLSIDSDNDPDVPAMLGASLALSLSDIPWDGPIAGVRIGRKEGAFLICPTYTERETADLDVIISGTKERINMIEAGAAEIAEDIFYDAVLAGDVAIKELIRFQQDIIREHAPAKAKAFVIEPAPELAALVKKEFSERIEQSLYQKSKKGAYASIGDLKAEWTNRASAAHPELFTRTATDALFEDEINDILHRRIIDRGERPDGRKTDQLRDLSATVDMLPRVHGSGLFMRGETHVLTSLTLGAPGDQQIIEGMEIRGKKHFLHHYNFPPFSVGETRPLRGPGRREIGHGALAGRAIVPLLPAKDDFPYTIRLVSEVLSSNGSSSMASVCGSSLALMQGGVPIKKHAAGAAMGLVLNDKGEYRVLTDIQGPEDHHGDMDFKVAGTRDGITAVQMDVKIDGITPEMLRSALTDARAARYKILDVMEATIMRPSAELSPYAPRIITLKINPEKIGAVIGPGGKMINEIIAETGVQIDIEDDGTIFITSENADGMARALAIVKQITREFKPGELAEGKVVRILDFGAFVELAPKQDGMVHISELAPWHVNRVTDIVNLGDVIPVKILEIDDLGRINLSLKAVPGRYKEGETGPADASGRDSYERHPQRRPEFRRPRR